MERVDRVCTANVQRCFASKFGTVWQKDRVGTIITAGGGDKSENKNFLKLSDFELNDSQMTSILRSFG